MLMTMMNFLMTFKKEEEGQGMVEYALIIGLIAVVVIGVITLLGTDILALLTQITDAI